MSKHYIYAIEPDEDAESPRHWDNLGHLACWQQARPRWLKLGDQELEPSCGREEYLERLVEEANPGFVERLERRDLTPEQWQEAVTQAFSRYYVAIDWCHPQDGQAQGLIWVTKDRIREEYKVKRITKSVMGLAISALQSELDIYDQYLLGEVWGYQILEVPDEIIEAELEYCDAWEELNLQENHEAQELDGWHDFPVIDSLWGIYGLEYAKEQAQAALAQAEADYPARLARLNGQMELLLAA